MIALTEFVLISRLLASIEQRIDLLDLIAMRPAPERYDPRAYRHLGNDWMGSQQVPSFLTTSDSNFKNAMLTSFG